MRSEKGKPPGLPFFMPAIPTAQPPNAQQYYLFTPVFMPENNLCYACQQAILFYTFKQTIFVCFSHLALI